MDAVLEQGLDLIQALQALGSPALDAFFTAVTFLGDIEFYLLLAPIIIWSIDFGLGARVGVLVLLSGTVNVVLKDMIMQPRPCEFDPEVCRDEATGYGLPSGHAQNAVVFWGAIASWIGGPWAWTAAVILMLLIGLSRVYLGVHFPTDVLAGWAIGGLFLALYLGFGERVIDWLARSGAGVQIAMALGLAALFIAVDSNPEVVAAASAFGGLGTGLAITYRSLGFDASGAPWQRAARYVLGIAVIAGLFFGLGPSLPEQGPVAQFSDILLFGLIGFWTGFGAPWLFIRLGLAHSLLSDGMEDAP